MFPTKHWRRDAEATDSLAVEDCTGVQHHVRRQRVDLRDDVGPSQPAGGCRPALDLEGVLERDGDAVEWSDDRAGRHEVGVEFFCSSQGLLVKEVGEAVHELLRVDGALGERLEDFDGRELTRSDGISQRGSIEGQDGLLHRGDEAVGEGKDVGREGSWQVGFEGGGEGRVASRQSCLSEGFVGKRRCRVHGGRFWLELKVEVVLHLKTRPSSGREAHRRTSDRRAPERVGYEMRSSD